MSEKKLEEKLRHLASKHSCQDFILADAKDADMAFGIAAPGRRTYLDDQTDRFRTLAEYRQQIRENVDQGLVDIMLMSASTSELLAIEERLFDESSVTPAIRANDSTDIWSAAGSVYAKQPSRPFRTASIEHAMYGKLQCAVHERKPGVDLGLYSITFNNDSTLDSDSLRAYTEFRLEAERHGFRHFLEVFNPNALQHPVENIGRFLNDNIARTLAGVSGPGRPLFLKIAYHGPAAMEQLVSYDQSLIVGIMGGSSGTTFDAFHQLWEARKYGARAALYGRMINNSEHQPTFIQHLRRIADGEITDPAEAVRSYHSQLHKREITPVRSLDEDLQRTDRLLAYR